MTSSTSNKRNGSGSTDRYRMMMPSPLTENREGPEGRGEYINRRIDWVDYAKGICILLVVMMHSTLGVEKAAGATGWLGYVVEFSRPFRMPDFFLVSGLFLGLVIDRSWLRYLDRKVVHFLYFYVIWLTIQFAFKAPGWMAEGLTSVMLVNKYLAYKYLVNKYLLNKYSKQSSSSNTQVL